MSILPSPPVEIFNTYLCIHAMVQLGLECPNRTSGSNIIYLLNSYATMEIRRRAKG